MIKIFFLLLLVVPFVNGEVLNLTIEANVTWKDANIFEIIVSGGNAQTFNCANIDPANPSTYNFRNLWAQTNYLGNLKENVKLAVEWESNETYNLIAYTKPNSQTIKENCQDYPNDKQHNFSHEKDTGEPVKNPPLQTLECDKIINEIKNNLSFTNTEKELYRGQLQTTVTERDECQTKLSNTNQTITTPPPAPVNITEFADVIACQGQYKNLQGQCAVVEKIANENTQQKNELQNKLAEAKTYQSIMSLLFGIAGLIGGYLIRGHVEGTGNSGKARTTTTMQFFQRQR